MKWFKRRTFIIDGNFQYRFLGIAIIHFFIILLVIMASIFLPLMMQLDDSSLTWAQKELVAKQFISLHTNVWPPLLVALIGMTVHWIVFSHRIAGPLYRFRLALQAIAEGNLSLHLHLRKYDHLKNMATNIEDMTISLQSKIVQLENHQKACAVSLNDLKQAMAEGNTESMKQQLQRMEDRMEQLQTGIHQFQTVPISEARRGTPLRQPSPLPSQDKLEESS